METKPRFFGNHALGDGVSGVYLGDTVEELLKSLEYTLTGLDPDEISDPIVITVKHMTDAEIAALPEM